MQLFGLLALLRRLPAYQALLQQPEPTPQALLPAARPYVVAGLKTDRPGALILLTARSEMAQQIVVGLFPVFGDQSTVDRTDKWLREAQPVPALRRLVTEGRDNLARTLRAQARDRA